MRVLLLGVLLLTLATPARADDGLTGRVASAFFPRTVDAGLHSIAHARVGELAACKCLEHDNMRAGTAEVIALNSGVGDPVGSAVSQWISSPMHNAILSDGRWGRIGCAEAVTGAVHWFACVLADGPLPVSPVAALGAAPPAVVLPDTAMPAPATGS